MISILVLTTEIGNDLKDLQNFLGNIKDKTKNYDNIEVIIKLDNLEQKKNLDKFIELTGFDFRILLIIQIRSNEVQAVHANYDNLYLNTSDESKLLVLTQDKSNIILQDWDEILIEKYNHNCHLSGHDLFILKQNQSDTIIASSTFIDIMGGFGHSPNINSWLNKIIFQIKNNFGDDLVVNLPQNLIQDSPNEYPHIVDYDSKFIQEIINLQAASIKIKISNSLKTKKIKKDLQKFSLAESCDYINKKFGTFDAISIPTIRYLHSTTQYIIRFHVIPFFEAVTTMVLFKSNQMPTKESIPIEWIRHIDNWSLDGIEPIKVISDNPQTSNLKNEQELKKLEEYSSEEIILHDIIKRYGRKRAIIFLSKRLLMSPVKKIIKIFKKKQ